MRVIFKESFRQKFFLSILVIVLTATLLTTYFAFSLAPKSYLQVSFLDVGQGDSILFQTPRGGKILVDGGRDRKVLERLGSILPVGTNKLELVIATHDDSDHITGLIDVLKRYEVKVLLYSLPNSKSNLSRELMKVAAERNVQVVKISKPMIIKSDDGLLIKILFPVADMDRVVDEQEDIEVAGNDASIVTQFVFGENKILLTGDMPQTGEKYLIQKYGEELDSDILKLGHHGSDSSTEAEFLQTVSPEVAVVSAGKNNSFGHPHRSVLELLEKFGIKVYRTDEVGTITFRSNGVNFWKK